MKEQAVRISLRGDWIVRDGAEWIVNVPVAGGRKNFSFKEHGDSHKALQAARSFHAKKEREYCQVLEYIKKNGERPTTVRSDNNTGVNGITRKVFPNLTGRPNIVFLVYYTDKHRGLWLTKTFSTAEYIDEKKAFEEAKKQRKQWEKRYGK